MDPFQLTAAERSTEKWLLDLVKALVRVTGVA